MDELERGHPKRWVPGERPWVVYLMTPPPSEIRELARAATKESAKEAARDWVVEWTGDTSGLGFSGERVEIELEHRTPPEKGDHLRLRWDEFFETTVFEQFLAPAFGVELDDLGEVPRSSPDHARFANDLREIESWLLDTLQHKMGVHPYTLSGSLMYPADIEELRERATASVTLSESLRSPVRTALAHMLRELA
jgi:hypothetical protein